MSDIKPPPDQGLGLPDDLRVWFVPGSLIGLVLEALGSVQGGFEAAMHRPLLPRGDSRLLLTVLVYSYGTGLYASEEIARELRTDPQLIYLSAKAGITAERLRHFRRHHRGVLERTLTRLLHTAWGVRNEVEDEAGEADEMLFIWAAETRINRAVLADTMALDV